MAEKLKVEIVNNEELDLRYIDPNHIPEVFRKAAEVQFNAHVASGKITPEGMPTILVEPPEHKLDQSS